MGAHEERLRRLSGHPQRVEVEWLDSALRDGWHSADRIHDGVENGSLTAYTVGYLIREDTESITVAASLTIDPRTGLHDEYANALTIPQAVVVEVRELAVRRRR